MAFLKVYTGAILGYQVHDATTPVASIVRDSNGYYWCLYVVGTSLYCRRSTDSGVTWGDAETVVTESYSPPIYGISPDVAIDSSDVIHVVYGVRANGTVTYTLYHIYRDPVTGWSTKEDIIGSTGWYLYPKIAVDSSGDIHCVYHYGRQVFNKDLMYIKRTSGVWGSPVTLVTKNLLGMDSSYNAQDICVDSLDNLHVVYTGGVYEARGAHPDLFYKLYNGSWQAEEKIAGLADEDREQRYPSVAVDSSNVVHVVWQGEGYSVSHPEYNSEVCYVKGNTGAWDTPIALTDILGSVYSYGLSLAVNDLDEIDVCWCGKGYSPTNVAWHTGNHIKHTIDGWGIVNVLSDYSICVVGGMLWARHPPTANTPNGYAALMRGEVVANVVVGPDDPMTRVTGLVHRYSPGTYTLEMMLGDVTTEREELITREPVPALEGR